MYRRAVSVGALLALLVMSIGGPPVAAAGEDPNDQSAILAANREMEHERYAKHYGVSVEEAAAQQADRDAIDDPILALRTSRSDEFSGWYITHKPDYVLHIVAKEGTSARLDLPQLQTMKVVYETGKYSRAELRAVQAEVENLPFVTGTSLKETGVLEVAAGGLDGAGLVAKYGNRISLTEPDLDWQSKLISCTSRTNCDDPRGGIQVYPHDDNCQPDNSHCLGSAGFRARGNATGNAKLITAGHLGSESNGWEVSNNGYFLGPTGLNCNLNVNGGACDTRGNYDVQMINCTSTCDGTDNCVWFNGSQLGYCYAITVVKNIGQIGVGDPVLAMGYPEDPGGVLMEVTDSDDTWLTCTGCSVNHGFTTDTGLQTGSSGGPAYYNGRAWGIASIADILGGTYTKFVYADAGGDPLPHGAEYYLDVSICITASGCG